MSFHLQHHQTQVARTHTESGRGQGGGSTGDGLPQEEICAYNTYKKNKEKYNHFIQVFSIEPVYLFILAFFEVTVSSKAKGL